jgi:WD40 repeat protein
VTAANDGTVKLWDLATGKEVRRFTLPVSQPVNDFQQFLYRPYGVSAATSSDGKWVAASNGNELHLWETFTGKELGKVNVAEHYMEGITGIAIAQDRKWIATVRRDGEVTIWDPSDFEVIRQFATPAKSPAPFDRVANNIAVSPNGKQLVTETVTNDSKVIIQVYDPRTGEKTQRIQGEFKARVYCAAPTFSPDNKVLAWGDVAGIHMSDPVSGENLHTISTGRDAFLCGFAPDGNTLIVQSTVDRSLASYDVKTGKETHGTGADEHARELDLGWHGVVWTPPSLAVSPDGKQVASVFAGCAVAIFDVETGKLTNGVDGHADFVTRIIYSADGKFVTTMGYKDRTLRTWELKTGKLTNVIRGDATAENIFLSPNGEMVASIENDGARPARKWAVRITDASSGKELSSTEFMGAPYVHSVVFSPDSRLFARVGPGICLFNAATGEQVRELASAVNYDMTPSLPGFLFSPDGRFAAGTPSERPDMYAIWDVQSGAEVSKWQMRKYGDPGNAVFSPDSRSLAIDQNDGSIILYDVLTGKERRRYGKAVKEGTSPPPQPGAPRARHDHMIGTTLCFSPNGSQLAHAEGDVIRVWDFLTGEDLGSIQIGSLVTSFAFAPDGKSVATAGLDTTCVIWEIGTQIHAPTTRGGDVPAKALEAAWKDLNGESNKAFEALLTFTSAPQQTVALLKERIKPATEPDAKKIEKLVGALEDSNFDTRKNALEELKKLGKSAVPALKRALRNDPSAEARRRIDDLIADAVKLPITDEERQASRTIEVLERMAQDKAARELLQSLAKGAEGATITEEARAAMKRLGN